MKQCFGYIFFYSKVVELDKSQGEKPLWASYVPKDPLSVIKKRDKDEEKKEEENLKKREPKKFEKKFGVVKQKKLKDEKEVKGKTVSMNDLDIHKKKAYWDKKAENLAEGFKQENKATLKRNLKQKDEYDLDYDRGKLKKVKKKKFKKKVKLDFERIASMTPEEKKKLVQARQKLAKKKQIQKRYSTKN